MLATVRPDLAVVVAAAPTAPAYYLLADGRMLTLFGLPLAAGESPAGNWVRIDPGVAGDAPALGPVSPVFVERCVIDGQTGARTLVARDPTRRVGELIEGTGAGGSPAVADLARLLRPHVAGWVDGGV